MRFVMRGQPGCPAVYTIVAVCTRYRVVPDRCLELVGGPHDDVINHRLRNLLARLPSAPLGEVRIAVPEMRDLRRAAKLVENFTLVWEAPTSEERK